jgi:uncharacterized protein YjiS (DUF1127 family)
MRPPIFGALLYPMQEGSMLTHTFSAQGTHLLHLDQGRIRGFVRFFSRMAEAIETRRQLAGMDDRMLSDIGISRADALAEYERAPWDLGPPPRPGRRPLRPGRVARFRQWSREAARRYRTRKHIAELDERALKDIGITFAAAEHEANKPFWRA